MRLARRLPLALWAGVLVSVGGLLAPLLFEALPDRASAGHVAGELFRRTTLLSLCLALALLLLGTAAGPAGSRFLRLAPLGPALLLAVSDYAVHPLIEQARLGGGAGSRAFMLWHSVATGLYGLATIAAVALLVAELRRRD